MKIFFIPLALTANLILIASIASASSFSTLKPSEVKNARLGAVGSAFESLQNPQFDLASDFGFFINAINDSSVTNPKEAANKYAEFAGAIQSSSPEVVRVVDAAVAVKKIMLEGAPDSSDGVRMAIGAAMNDGTLSFYNVTPFPNQGADGDSQYSNLFIVVDWTNKQILGIMTHVLE